jgi:hypothetical protein
LQNICSIFSKLSSCFIQVSCRTSLAAALDGTILPIQHELQLLFTPW